MFCFFAFACLIHLSVSTWAAADSLWSTLVTLHLVLVKTSDFSGAEYHCCFRLNMIHSVSFPSIARPNEEFQLPGRAGDARTVGIFHPVMLARVINCALPWDQWACHLSIEPLYISLTQSLTHTHTHRYSGLCSSSGCIRDWVVWTPTHASYRMDWPSYCH